VCDSFTTCTPPAATLTAVGSPTPTTAVAICQGDTALLKAPGGAGNSYLFLLNGTVVGTGSGSDSVLRATQAGSYRVVVTNATGCFDTSAAAGIMVTVNPLPTPTVTQTAFNVLSTGSFTTYQWNLAGQPITGATSQTYTAPFTGNGSYTVTVTNANGCRATSAAYNLTTASVGGAAGVAANIRVFPNPTTGRVFIESSTPVTAQVWTVDGRKLTEVKKATSVDLSNLAPGVYTLRLTDANGTVLMTERLTKTN
jgi:membrane carboxypeptidase/penicillin-binding protein PbpC